MSSVSRSCPGLVFCSLFISKTSLVNSGKIQQFTRILKEIEPAKDRGVLPGMQRIQ
jgi:hypothetical protein